MDSDQTDAMVRGPLNLILDQPIIERRLHWLGNFGEIDLEIPSKILLVLKSIGLLSSP